MIDVHNLHKAYGRVQALRGVSFTIGEGEIVGLLGPNGAGKTTIIKSLTGYLQPDDGRVTINGRDVTAETEAVQAQIGYLPENTPLYPELTVQAYLRMMAGLRRIPAAEQADALADAIVSTGLADHVTRPIGALSKGYRQRVGLAQAILHRPRLLILDEPTVGLDPTQIVEIRQLIRRLAQHSTVLFSTHILSEVEVLCDSVLMLIHGEMRLDARLADVARTSDAVLTLTRPVDGVADLLGQLDGVNGVSITAAENGPAVYRIAGADTADLCPAIYQTAVAHEWPVRELKQETQTLESVFNRLALGGELPAGRV